MSWGLLKPILGFQRPVWWFRAISLGILEVQVERVFGVRNVQRPPYQKWACHIAREPSSAVWAKTLGSCAFVMRGSNLAVGCKSVEEYST